MTTVFSKNKLTRPRSVVMYRRERLNQKLDQCFTFPITWIEGPAGSGKTTLINNYLTENWKGYGKCRGNRALAQTEA